MDSRFYTSALNSVNETIFPSWEIDCSVFWKPKSSPPPVNSLFKIPLLSLYKNIQADLAQNESGNEKPHTSYYLRLSLCVHEYKSS